MNEDPSLYDADPFVVEETPAERAERRCRVARAERDATRYIAGAVGCIFGGLLLASLDTLTPGLWAISVLGACAFLIAAAIRVHRAGT